jgi:hypothetical protein
VAKIILHIDDDHGGACEINGDGLGLRHHLRRLCAAQGPHEISVIRAHPP